MSVYLLHGHTIPPRMWLLMKMHCQSSKMENNTLNPVLLASSAALNTEALPSVS